MTGLTVKQLSLRVGVPARRLVELMSEDAARGLVEQDVTGGWRLTAPAERAYGSSLRNIMAPNTLGAALRERSQHGSADVRDDLVEAIRHRRAHPKRTGRRASLRTH